MLLAFTGCAGCVAVAVTDLVFLVVCLAVAVYDFFVLLAFTGCVGCVDVAVTDLVLLVFYF